MITYKYYIDCFSAVKNNNINSNSNSNSKRIL